MSWLLTIIGSPIFELAFVIVVFAGWLQSGLPTRSAGGPSWCAGPNLDTRDRIVIACIGATAVLSFAWWWRGSDAAVHDQCMHYFPYGGSEAQTRRALPAYALCAAAVRAQHTSAWHRGPTWVLVALQLVVLALVAARLAGWLHPTIVRVTTRLVMVAVDVLLVLVVYAGSPYDQARTWVFWLCIGLAALASMVMMRTVPWVIRGFAD